MRHWLAGSAAALALSCGSCVARGSRIRTPRSLRLVEALTIGDEVVAVNPHTGEHEVTTIVDVRSSEREHGSLVFEGSTLNVTSDHPLFDPETREFHPAGDWLLGLRTRLLSFDGEVTTPIDVKATRVFAGLEAVFDLTVASALHTFVAEGVVVHNKPQPSCRAPNGERAPFVGDPAARTTCRCADGGIGRWDCDRYGAEAECRECGLTDAGIE